MKTFLPSSKELQGFPGFVFALLRQQPRGRFRHNEHAAEEQRRESAQDPGQHVPRHEGADDVSDQDAEREEDGRERPERAAYSRRCALANLAILIKIPVSPFLRVFFSRFPVDQLTKIWAAGALKPIMAPSKMRPMYNMEL